MEERESLRACRCDACCEKPHASDCAVHNAPALPTGPCDCRTKESLIERPASCPRPGIVDGFDAGWNAHEVGLGRESVQVFTTDPEPRAWALMAWDVRQKLAEGE